VALDGVARDGDAAPGRGAGALRMIGEGWSARDFPGRKCMKRKTLLSRLPSIMGRSSQTPRRPLERAYM
jgi:hypothetical protein